MNKNPILFDLSVIFQFQLFDLISSVEIWGSCVTTCCLINWPLNSIFFQLCCASYVRQDSELWVREQCFSSIHQLERGIEGDVSFIFIRQITSIYLCFFLMPAVIVFIRTGKPDHYRLFANEDCLITSKCTPVKCHVFFQPWLVGTTVQILLFIILLKFAFPNARVDR